MGLKLDSAGSPRRPPPSARSCGGPDPPRGAALAEDDDPGRSQPRCGRRDPWSAPGSPRSPGPATSWPPRSPDRLRRPPTRNCAVTGLRCACVAGSGMGWCGGIRSPPATRRGLPVTPPRPLFLVANQQGLACSRPHHLRARVHAKGAAVAGSMRLRRALKGGGSARNCLSGVQERHGLRSRAGGRLLLVRCGRLGPLATRVVSLRTHARLPAGP